MHGYTMGCAACEYFTGPVYRRVRKSRDGGCNRLLGVQSLDFVHILERYMKRNLIFLQLLPALPTMNQFHTVPTKNRIIKVKVLQTKYGNDASFNVETVQSLV
jgi:hypothetical protein